MKFKIDKIFFFIDFFNARQRAKTSRTAERAIQLAGSAVKRSSDLDLVFLFLYSLPAMATWSKRVPTMTFHFSHDLRLTRAGSASGVAVALSISKPSCRSLHPPEQSDRAITATGFSTFNVECAGRAERRRRFAFGISRRVRWFH